MQWRPWSVFQGRRKNRSFCAHWSNYQVPAPHTPRGSVAGIDASSSVSSAYEKSGGQNTSGWNTLRFWLFLLLTATNMSVVIQQVVGEFEAVKRHRLLHPLGSTGRWVWVKVHPAGRYHVGPSCHQPGGAVERIPDADNSRAKSANLILFKDHKRVKWVEELVPRSHRQSLWPVSFVINRDKVHEQDVFSSRVHPSDLHLEGWKHPPAVWTDRSN